MRIRLREINRDDVRFETGGDYEDDYQIFNQKLNIINKYFSFETAKGYYIIDKALELYLDKDIRIIGVIEEEPYIVNFIYRNRDYHIDIHPHDSMGGFDNYIFEEQIKSIYEQVNTISLVLVHDGYAVFSKHIKISELGDYKFVVVDGDQMEGKLIKLPILGEVPNQLLSNIVNRKMQ